MLSGFLCVLTSYAARGGGRGGFQQRDAGPPDTVLGTPKHQFDSVLLTHLRQK